MCWIYSNWESKVGEIFNLKVQSKKKKWGCRWSMYATTGLPLRLHIFWAKHLKRVQRTPTSFSYKGITVTRLSFPISTPSHTFLTKISNSIQLQINFYIWRDNLLGGRSRFKVQVYCNFKSLSWHSLMSLICPVHLSN